MSKLMRSKTAVTDLEGVIDGKTDQNLSETAIKKLFANRRRRIILSYLQVHNGPVEIESMVEHLTYQELKECSGDTLTRLFEEITESVWNEHLPLLAEHDVIKYDRESEKLRGWTNVGQLAYRLRTR